MPRLLLLHYCRTNIRILVSGDVIAVTVATILTSTVGPGDIEADAGNVLANDVVVKHV